MLQLIMTNDNLSVEVIRTFEMVEDMKMSHGIDMDSIFIFHLQKAFSNMEQKKMTGIYRLKLKISRSTSLTGIIIEPLVEFLSNMNQPYKDNEYQRLEERDDWLQCLEAAGVDNWQGMEEAIRIHNEE